MRLRPSMHNQPLGQRSFERSTPPTKSRPVRSHRYGVRAAVLALFSMAGSLAGGLTGCSTIEPVAPAAGPTTDPAQLYMRLTLDHPAITLSTAPGYNTLQLTATPRDALGNPMSGLPAPTYHSPDTTKVRVTAEGLLTAVGTATDFKVTATLTAGLVTRADTAWITVTNLTTPPVLDTFSIDPVSPYSDVLSLYPPFALGNVQVTLYALGLFFGGDFAGLAPDPLVRPRAVATNGTTISGLQIEYASLDPLIATVGRRPGLTDPITGDLQSGLTLVLPGQVRIVAQTTAYGVSKTDTTTYTVTPWTNQMVEVRSGADGSPRFFPEEVQVIPGGVVTFLNQTVDTVDVTFDDPADVTVPSGPLAIGACDYYALVWGAIGWTIPDPGPYCDGPGNALLGGTSTPDDPSSLGDAIKHRQFPVAGVYRYHSTRNGASGRVVVSNVLE